MNSFTERMTALLIAYLGDADGSGKVISVDYQNVFIKAMMDMLNQKLAVGFNSPEEEIFFFRAALPFYNSLSLFVSRQRGESHPHWVSRHKESPPDRSSLHWTGTKAEAVEIIYELVHVGVLSNGQATIVQVTRWFEQEFQIDLGNVSKIFQDIRNRKKETTSLALKMDKSLRQYIEQLDEEEQEKNNHSRRA